MSHNTVGLMSRKERKFVMYDTLVILEYLIPHPEFNNLSLIITCYHNLFTIED